MALRLLCALLVAAVALASPWQDTPETTRLWETISRKDVAGLRSWIARDPEVPHLRAADGRSGLHWAYEFESGPMVRLLVKEGASQTATDAQGKMPITIATDLGHDMGQFSLDIEDDLGALDFEDVEDYYGENVDDDEDEYDDEYDYEDEAPAKAKVQEPEEEDEEEDEDVGSAAPKVNRRRGRNRH